MASFAAVEIFGVAVTMSVANSDRAQQDNAYPGVSGVESLDQGLRGRFTTVAGRLVGDGVEDLAAAEALFDSYRDGNTYALVDTAGTTWPNVKLVSFETAGKIQPMAPGTFVMRQYRARFQHLTG